MTDVMRMRKRRSLESFRFGRRDEEVAIDDVPLPENERRCSLRSFGSSIRSMFGRENDVNLLSEFQQQESLVSVFESEHMWSHFKAHLADNKIQTSAGVRAMLPEFVNDRVMDGSVGSDRPVHPPSKRSSFTGSSNHSMDVSDKCHSIDYRQALRGDAGHVLCLHETVNREAYGNRDSKGLGKIIPACLIIDNTRRRSPSVFSSLGWNDDEPSDDDDDDDCPASSSLDLSSRSRLSLDLSSRSRLSLDSSSRRASFLASLGF